MTYQDITCNELKLFAFVKEFQYIEDAKFCEETLYKEFSLQKLDEWNKYWLRNGYEVALKQWKQFEAPIVIQNLQEIETSEKESYFEIPQGVSEDEHDLNQCEIKSESSKNIATSEGNSSSGVSSEIWEDFFTNVYYEEHINFSEVFDLYTLQLYQSLVSKPDDDVSKEYDFTDIRFDYDQLKSLGLPTSFGISAVPKTKKNKTKLKKSLSLESLYLDNSTSPNSSEDEIFVSCNSDMDSDEKPTEFPKEEEKSQDKLGKISNKSIEKSKKKKKNRKLKNVPAFMVEDKNFLKYWRKRFSLFSLFDEGILLDKESWFSVTPEKVAIYIAERLACDTLIDGFCGCGGNTIQFAKLCNKVIAIDIDPEKIKMAKNNAKIYGVEEKIEFIVGDFLEICDKSELKADVVFVSPPWGGPKYKLKQDYDIEKDLLPISASELIDKVRKISNNIGLFLPRNAKIPQVIKLAGIGNKCEVQHNYLDSRLVAITALYGEHILKNKNDEKGVDL